MNKSQYILVAIAIILALFVFTMALFSFFRPVEKTPIAQPLPSPTPAIKPVTYDKKTSDRMLEIVNKRTSFTSSDAASRKLLVSQAESNPLIYNSTTVRIEYLSSPDQFMAEILTSDIESAKNEAVSFLSSAGLSKDAICHLPLVFYLSIQARLSLPDSSPAFNPLAPNC